MDTETLRIGDDWEKRINQALLDATVLIIVIGPQWLRIADEHGRRRIDRDDDWVRQEIQYAIQNRLKIIPLFLADTPIPSGAALPRELATLPKYQTFRLRDETWEQDLEQFVSRLLQLGFVPIGSRSIKYPVPHVRIRELTADELATELHKLQGWESSESDLPGHEPLTRTEITKVFEFSSFEDAMLFMASAAGHISKVDHHPRWENIWKTVTVWLSTWDIGHRISKLDLDLAEHLNSLYDKYRPRRRGRAAAKDTSTEAENF